ncbi:hypothetical protein K7432_006289 [Basidiobolus ranarum]|uniref:HMG box domain-containing protein n=1 Tax=Basidiobolus ranarum TaxID=34480 RepID=A0ABR2WVA5_9FUNG
MYILSQTSGKVDLITTGQAHQVNEEYIIHGSGSYHFIPEGYYPILVKNSVLLNIQNPKVPESIPPHSQDLLANTKTQKIPRPANAFIIYRKEKQPIVAAKNPGICNTQISKIIGQMWRDEGLETREKYQRKAEEAKATHLSIYPKYKYTPRRKKQRKLSKNEDIHSGSSPPYEENRFQLASSPEQIVDSINTPTDSEFSFSLSDNLDEYASATTGLVFDNIVSTYLEKFPTNDKHARLFFR